MRLLACLGFVIWSWGVRQSVHAETNYFEVCRQGYNSSLSRTEIYLDEPGQPMNLQEQDLRNMDQYAAMAYPGLPWLVSFVDWWQPLYPGESWMWQKYPALTRTSIHLAVLSKLQSEEYSSQDAALKGQGSEMTIGPDLFFLDMYRHGLWSARMAHYFGHDIAHCLLTLHEVKAPHYAKLSLPVEEEDLMDLVNNQVGVRIGLALRDQPVSVIPTAVRSALKEGQFYMYDPYRATSDCRQRALVRSFDPRRLDTGKVTRCH